uniref:EGF-like domain-containing protein n=1 Tax=Poecilia formosa TaxID=48698 RepID=A0A087YR08_POEFO
CRHSQCHSHGACEAPSDGGDNLVCTCDLGYSGEFCETTVNGHLSTPLTISVIVVIVGLVILAFVFAKIRQRQKRNKRKQLAAQQGYNVSP